MMMKMKEAQCCKGVPAPEPNHPLEQNPHHSMRPTPLKEVIKSSCYGQGGPYRSTPLLGGQCLNMLSYDIVPKAAGPVVQ